MSDTDLKNITESHARGLRLEGTCGDHLVQPSFSKQDQIEEVTQGYVQLYVYISLLLWKKREERCQEDVHRTGHNIPDVVSPVLNRGA